jgi:hypothetical protein
LLRRVRLSEWQVLLVDLPDCPFEQPARYFKVKKELHNCFAIVDKEFDGGIENTCINKKSLVSMLRREA